VILGIELNELNCDSLVISLVRSDGKSAGSLKSFIPNSFFLARGVYGFLPGFDETSN
jgi:hypothetical protein